MRILIDAAGTYEEKRNKKKRMRRLDASEDESDEDDLEEQRRQDELAVVVDGEHLVLKNLTNESLPYFIEAILLCAIASLFRAVPNKMNSQGHPDVNPFAEYCHAMLVFETCLQVFAQAETCGFNLPLKTNLLLLRGGAYVTRSVKAIVTKCITWRVEQGVTDTAGELKHLSALFGAAYSMTTTMETVQSGFQDRVVLKMQHDGGGRRRGGWTSELLAKTYGKKYNTRRWISKTEAKLLPFFSHGIQELQDFLQDQSEVNNIELTNARDEWKSGERFWNGLDYRGVMLTDDQLVSACRTLQVEELTPTLLKDWRPVVDKGDSESDYDDEEGKADIQELEEDLLSEDDDDGIDGFAVKSYATDSVNCELNPAMSMPGGRKKPAVELLDNEDVGFPTIVVNFKKHKKAH
ncbi:hypothetical protein PHYBOEH_008815 [Phytophthora boehmeriae]|uniref:Uncharacterized protein n=1 Tax=Phytophthora boehmeriae TaxID=109152 RepID=A0A8T1X5W3_9STRA|nr:hypothetical protein PHYBOEH_008815 [Phytophthora boehmeriae]